jgi:hypothetical protein
MDDVRAPQSPVDRIAGGEGPAADVHTSAEHLRALLTRRALVP